MDKNSKELGNDYEDFSVEVIKRIQDLESRELATPIKIEQRVKIPAPYGRPREIDILLTYRDPEGKERRAAIECKNYKSAVSVEKIDAFATKCSNLGVDKAIFFSKNGFQQAAIASAKYNNIQLVELRVPNEKDWKNRIRKITINMQVRMPTIMECGINAPLGEGENSYIEVMLGTPIFYGNGTQTTLKKEVSIDSSGKNVGEYVFEKDYANAFFLIGEKRVSFSHIHLKYRIFEDLRVIEIDGDDIVLALLKIVGHKDFLVENNGKTRELEKVEN